MPVEPGEVQLMMGVQKRVRALSDVVCGDISELYKMGSELGFGRFSTVRAAESLGTGKRFALKVVENESLNDDENLVALEQEVKILRMLEHPYVVKLKEVVTTPDRTYLSMELLNGGELFEKIVEVGSFPEPEAAVVFARLVAAVDFLHARDVVHRDLKPENILFVEGKERIPTDIKVIDFGYAGIWSADAQLTGLCGTPDYVAPEILSWYDVTAETPGVAYGKPSDVWSLGVLLYVLLSGCAPFAADEEDELLRKVAAAQYAFPEREWRAVSADAKDLIARALVGDPAKRITLAEVKEHAWCKAAVQSVAAELKASGVGRTAVRTRRDDSGACECLVQ